MSAALPPGRYDGRVVGVHQANDGSLRLAVDIPAHPTYSVTLTWGPVLGNKRPKRVENEEFDRTFRWERKTNYFGMRSPTAVEPCVRCGENTAAWLLSTGDSIHLACCSPSWFKHLTTKGSKR